jgi:hypothetical protein
MIAGGDHQMHTNNMLEYRRIGSSRLSNCPASLMDELNIRII